jgi:hypothetical protein
MVHRSSWNLRLPAIARACLVSTAIEDHWAYSITSLLLRAHERIRALDAIADKNMKKQEITYTGIVHLSEWNGRPLASWQLPR